MIHIDIPGFRVLNLKYLLLDFYGTIAFDGRVNEEIRELLRKIQTVVEIHIITADTFGTVVESMEGFDVKITTIAPGHEDKAKQDLLQELGKEFTVAIGNGRNDRLMLKVASLGIMVINEEGISSKALQSADIICRSISEALDLLLNPNRIKATLRN